MGEEIRFKVGDWVRFKPGEEDYARRHYGTMGPHRIASITEWGPSTSIMSLNSLGDTKGSHTRRLQHDVFMTAARAVVQNNQPTNNEREQESD